MTALIVSNAIAALLLPPLNALLLAAVGLALLRRRPKLGTRLLIAALALLYLLSTPMVGDGMLHLLETSPALSAPPHRDADAIVVLAAGTYFDAPEYGGDTVNPLGLERARYAARLARQTGLPILATGGSPAGGVAEAVALKNVLENDFRVPVRWIEVQSLTTLDNAFHSRKILQAAGIGKIYLVTHAWHMPRALLVFRAAGFDVVPAPTGFTSYNDFTLSDFLPSVRALVRSYYALHEAIGIAWYRARLLGRAGSIGEKKPASAEADAGNEA